MGKYAEQPWYLNLVAKTVAKYGEVPPVWIYSMNSHPCSIEWRMGSGEDYAMMFGEWWSQQAMTFEERVAYFRRWPAPPRWLGTMADYLWDIESWETEGGEEFDYAPYFRQLTELGFADVDQYEADLNDEKWLE